MPVTHFDIQDQWNPDIIEEARQEKEMFSHDCKHWKAVNNACWNLPEEDDEAVEVNRNYGG